MNNLEFAMDLIEQYDSIAQTSAPEFIIEMMLDKHTETIYNRASVAEACIQGMMASGRLNTFYMPKERAEGAVQQADALIQELQLTGEQKNDK